MEERFELKNVKGTFDFLPQEQLIRNKIMDTLKEVFALYGYLPLETPILCYYDLLASKYAGGAEILKEVYTLTDQGQRTLGLRYDLTVPFSKVLSMQKELSLPFRRYEIGKVFRDGPVKVGRNREFYQCDVDVCGIQGLGAEAELFSLALEGYKRLGIDVELHWNNRKFLSGLMQYCSIKEDLVSKAILAVDKLEKVGKESVLKELVDLGFVKEKIETLFSLLQLSFDEIKEKIGPDSNDLLKEGLMEIEELTQYLKEMNILNNCPFKPFLARGLEIYTGTVWEIFDKEKRVTSSLGGGGRYDKIITNFINDGNLYPAIGMCFGLEPIYEILKNDETILKKSPYDVYLFPLEINAHIFGIAQKLRQNNIKVLLEMNRTKLKKGLDYANKNHIPYVLIIGEDEIKKEKYALKDMEKGIQEELTIENLIEKLKK